MARLRNSYNCHFYPNVLIFLSLFCNQRKYFCTNIWWNIGILSHKFQTCLLGHRIYTGTQSSLLVHKGKVMDLSQFFYSYQFLHPSVSFFFHPNFCLAFLSGVTKRCINSPACLQEQVYLIVVFAFWFSPFLLDFSLFLLICCNKFSLGVGGYSTSLPSMAIHWLLTLPLSPSG